MRLVAVEIDPVLAGELPDDRRACAGRRGPGRQCYRRRARGRGEGDRRARATVLAANLPYNVAVPVVLHLLAALPSLRARGRHGAGRGRRPDVRGARQPGVRGAVGQAGLVRGGRPAGTVPRSVFWPVPNVDSKLVAFTRRDPPPTTASREEVFAVIDAAFGQRRKTLRAALAAWAGSPAEAERVLRAAGVDPGRAARPRGRGLRPHRPGQTPDDRRSDRTRMRLSCGDGGVGFRVTDK